MQDFPELQADISADPRFPAAAVALCEGATGFFSSHPVARRQLAVQGQMRVVTACLALDRDIRVADLRAIIIASPACRSPAGKRTRNEPLAQEKGAATHARLWPGDAAQRNCAHYRTPMRRRASASWRRGSPYNRRFQASVNMPLSALIKAHFHQHRVRWRPLTYPPSRRKVWGQLWERKRWGA
jgi:hypothetical protein